MKRVKIIVAYDGTNYHGWQIQPNGITIESVLNTCLSELLKEPIKVIGASRTDAGVHARCNIAVFDTETRMPIEKISYALNQRLPEDIKIQRSEQCNDDFHPRFCKSRKTYLYQINNSEFAMPTNRLYAHFNYTYLDIELMRQASKYLVGEHDFKSFCATRSVVENTIRTIYDIDIQKQDDVISIKICGNGFLYNMVRIIVGTLIEIGQGKIVPGSIVDILSKKDRIAAGPTAPANGLMLYNYEFERE